MAIQFPRRAPARSDKTGARTVAIRVTNMTARDAVWWDLRIQPSLSLIAGRADRLWYWSPMLPALQLDQLRRGYWCRALVIRATADSGRLVRAAMVLVILGYPHLDTAAASTAHFLWFMSVAPDPVLKRFGVSEPPSLGRVILDITMVLSDNVGLGGRIGLHAAPAGGPRLAQFYERPWTENGCELIRLPETSPLPTVTKRKNDGRFFYTDDARAAVLLARGSVWR